MIETQPTEGEIVVSTQRPRGLLRDLTVSPLLAKKIWYDEIQVDVIQQPLSVEVKPWFAPIGEQAHNDVVVRVLRPGFSFFPMHLPDGVGNRAEEVLDIENIIHVDHHILKSDAKVAELECVDLVVHPPIRISGWIADLWIGAIVQDYPAA